MVKRQDLASEIKRRLGQLQQTTGVSQWPLGYKFVKLWMGLQSCNKALHCLFLCAADGR